ncbi:MAG: hypothetical protein ACMUHX_04460 [bacterium]
MKARYRYQTTMYILFVCIICVGILVASAVDSQFTGFTIAPPNTAIGYGGFFNPYVFWPSSNIRAAAAASPLVLYSPAGFDTFGLGNLFGNLTQLGNGTFNPVLGFGNPALTFGNPILAFGNPVSSLGGLSLGLNNPLGSLSLAGLNSLNPLALAPLIGIPGISAAAPLGAISPIRTAAQTGTWTGTWTSTYIAFVVLFNTGPMMLNIVEDPLLGTVAGTTILQGSRYASALTEVAGVLVNNVITLEGFLFTGFDIGLTCYLTSPTTMNGFYTVYGTTTPILDQGIFTLTLLPAVI